MNCEQENQQADELLEQDSSPLSSRALRLGYDENFSTNSHTEILPRNVHLLSYLQKTAEKVVYAGNHQTEFRYSQYSHCYQLPPLLTRIPQLNPKHLPTISISEEIFKPPNKPLPHPHMSNLP